MAGDWIKIEQVTPDKPEVHRMAAALDMDPDAVLGKLIRVWIWADQQTITGNAPSVTSVTLDHVARCDGFATAMISVGWLNVNKSGSIFPNFDRHNGKSAKQRALGQSRAKRFRNAKVTPAPLPEKRREEKRGNKVKKPYYSPTAVLPGQEEVKIPNELQGDRFHRVWEEWVAHRKEIKHPLTDMGAKMTLKKLAKMGLEQAIEAMENSIAGGYQGVFPPNERKSSGGTADRRISRIAAEPGKYDDVGEEI